VGSLSHGRRDDEVLARELQGLEQVAFALLARGALAGVDLQHDLAVEAGDREVPQEGAGLHHAAAGHQVLVLGRAGAVGEVHVAQPRADPLGHRHHVGAGDRRVREVDRGVGVRLLRRVPAGTYISSPSATLGGARQGYMFSTAKAMPVSSRGGDALDEAGGVLALPPERRVHDDHLGADGLGHLRRPLELAHGSVPQTRWVNSRHGAWIATMGSSWWSDSCLTADDCWLSASMPTMTSMRVVADLAAYAKACAVDSGRPRRRECDGGRHVRRRPP
jgi:hypothetical protein